MNRLPALLLLLAAVPVLQGCLAKTALDVATAPVRIAGRAADLATTSQSEADEKRGRQLRQREERLGKLERQYAKESRRCESGNEDACRAARQTYDEIAELLPTVPAPPSR
jgi:hypothetical protein